MIKLNKLIGIKEKLFNERGEIENNNKGVRSEELVREKEVMGSMY